MALIEYSLFRVRFVKPRQLSILHYDVSARDIFLAALEEHPVAQVIKGYRWQIGRVQMYSQDAGYFRLGRSTASVIEIYDARERDFMEADIETSPYTHCVFSAAVGFIGIAKKYALARHTSGIARRIQERLSHTRQVLDNAITVEVLPIPDPESFLREIQAAHSVTKFSATFHGPNPIDADELFQRPLSIYLSEVGGEKGKAEVQGDDLNREVITAVARSTAATGNEASARIIFSPRERPRTIHLKGDTVRVRYEDEIHDPRTALNDLTRLYQRVRRDESNSN